MTRDEIQSAINNNAVNQIMWYWNLRSALIYYKPEHGDDYLEECQTMVDWLELEAYDLETMLQEAEQQ